MKRNITKIFAALALLAVFALPIKAWADDVTFDIANNTGFTANASGTSGGSANSPVELVASPITVACDNGYFSGSQLRVYHTNGGTMTISTTDGNISKIVITCTANGTSNYGPGKLSGNGYTASTGKTGTWEGTATASVTLTATAQVRITEIVVTYTPGGGSQLPSTTTTITASQDFNNDIQVGTTAGTLTSAVTETASGNAVSGATVTWASTDQTVATVDRQTGAVTLVAVGTTNITATYEGDQSHAGSVGTYELTVINSAYATYDFSDATKFFTDAALTTNVPTGNTTSVGTFYYENGDVFTADGTKRYFGAGSNKYFFIGTTGATLALPTYEGYKITQLIIHNSTGCSTKVNVAIVSGSNTAATGQTWENQGVNYTYNIASEYQTSALSVKITNDYNAQITGITVVREEINSNKVATPTFEPAGGVITESTDVTINCDTDDATIYYTTDGSTPTTSSAVYSQAITVNSTMTLKAIAVKSGMTDSNVGEAAFTRKYFVNLTQATGGTISVNPAQAEVGQTVTLTASSNVGYTFGSWTVTPSVTLSGNTFTMPANDVTVTAIFIASTDGRIVSFSINDKVEMTATVFEGGSIDLTKFVADVTTEGYTFSGWSETANGTVLTSPYTPSDDITLYAQYGEVTASDYTLVTNVNQLEAGNLVVITAHNTLEYALSTDQRDNNRNYSTGITKTASPYTYITITGNDVCELTLGKVVDGNNTYWTFYDPNYSDGSNTGGYLYSAGGSSNNYLRTQHTNSANGEWTVTVSQTGDATIVSHGECTHNNLKYNTTGHIFSSYLPSSGNTHTVFMYTKPASKSSNVNRDDVEATSNVTAIPANVIVTVKSNGIVYLTGSNNGNEANLIVEEGGQLVASNNVKGTMLKSVIGYGNNTTGNYYLISTPLTTNTNPTNVLHMINTAGYDLYYFDQNPTVDPETGIGLEWRNYKQGEFNLQPGSGYLYANSESLTLEFAGANLRAFGTFEKNITYAGDQTFAGWNLVGNPFPCNAAVNMAFYKMNSNNDGISTNIMSADDVIAPMEGVFVLATSDAGNDQKVTFTATTDAVTTQDSKGITLEVNRENVMLDRAIVGMNEGSMVSKLRLSSGVTELYIPQGDKDYALVGTNGQGELPVNFKASRNATYTISANAENVEMNYLHLIDNMTGADVDLLATPSYTFDARTTDYTSRFRLVFNGNSIDENTTATETFAFFNGESWSVSNQGEASLQVVDVMGRIVNTQNINGNATINLNETPGIYMLRLVNGNNVKVQKIVVR